jgi:membrane-anchored mycosin MYCP
MTQNTQTPEKFKDTGTEELVVDLRQVDFVAERLRQLGGEAEVDKGKQNPTLGLGVVKVLNVDRFAVTINTSVQAAVEEQDDRFPKRGSPHSNLDVILNELRYQLRKEFNGWFPEIGKNRTMYGVHGSPHIGGSGYPQPADALKLPGYPSGSLRVGLIDTAVYPLEQFTDRVEYLGDANLRDNPPFTQLAGHGTFCTGLILQAAPTATVVARKVLSDELATSTVWQVANAMAEFADQDVSVLVLPLVCFARDGIAPLAMQRAVDVLRNKMVVLAAAGNHGDAPDEDGHSIANRPAFPAACDGAVAVGSSATADGLGLAAFSPPNAPWVQLLAPGNEVTSTYLRGEVRYLQIGTDPPERETDWYEGSARWSGTSFSTATLGGRIAAQAESRKVPPVEVLDKLLDGH